jgi:hypothetical protein
MQSKAIHAKSGCFRATLFLCLCVQLGPWLCAWDAFVEDAYAHASHAVQDTAQPSGKGPTPSGYYFTATATVPVIYVFSGSPELVSLAASRIPPVTRIRVTVQNAAGQPVAGVPVTFALPPDPAGQDALALSPQGDTTNRDGTAEAILQHGAGKATPGVSTVLVRVDNMTDAVRVHVSLVKVDSSHRH